MGQLESLRKLDIAQSARMNKKKEEEKKKKKLSLEGEAFMLGYTSEFKVRPLHKGL
jgi:hypothetical protein